MKIRLTYKTVLYAELSNDKLHLFVLEKDTTNSSILSLFYMKNGIHKNFSLVLEGDISNFHSNGDVYYFYSTSSSIVMKSIEN